jgi:hypothetical protein
LYPALSVSRKQMMQLLLTLDPQAAEDELDRRRN